MFDVGDWWNDPLTLAYGHGWFSRLAVGLETGLRVARYGQAAR